MQACLLCSVRPTSPASKHVREYPGVLLAGMEEPVTFSGRQGFDSRILKREQERVSLAGPGQDVVEALERLADALGAPGSSHLPKGMVAELQRPALPKGKLTVEKACQTMAALQPEGAIVVDEGITSSSAYYPMSPRVAPHTLLTGAGTTIGWGMPCAVGAAVACPDRPVIGLQGDGSAMFTVQALWTQAREVLNITTLIFSNRNYNACATNSPGTASHPPVPLRGQSPNWSVRRSAG